MTAVQVTPEQLAGLRATLLNTSGNVQLHERFRSLFMLKAVGGDEVIQIIAEGTCKDAGRVGRPAKISGGWRTFFFSPAAAACTHPARDLC